MNQIESIFRRNFADASPGRRLFSALVLTAVLVALGAGIVYAVTSLTVTDTFHDTSKVASAVNVTVDTVNGQVFLASASAWSCGSPLLDTRDGKSYNTVLIGSQCWMQQNLNVGTMINVSVPQDTSTSSVQKYCYSNNEGNCTTNGGLYQWNQAMGGSVTEGAQGICPAGWHIPSNNDWTLLERTTCTSDSCVTDFPYDNSTTGWRGTNEGTTLLSNSGLFKGLLAGYAYGGSFSYSGSDGYFWTSLPSSGSAWDRNLNSGRAASGRNTNDKGYSFSVRCLED